MSVCCPACIDRGSLEYFLIPFVPPSLYKIFSASLIDKISFVFQLSQELLMFKLRGNTDSPSDPRHSVNFDLGSENLVDTACFNPLHQVDHIGKKKLDQVSQFFYQLAQKCCIYKILYIILIKYILHYSNYYYYILLYQNIVLN